VHAGAEDRSGDERRRERRRFLRQERTNSSGGRRSPVSDYLKYPVMSMMA
jgi:hypothetical protein